MLVEVSALSRATMSQPHPFPRLMDHCRRGGRKGAIAKAAAADDYKVMTVLDTRGELHI